MQIYSQNVRNLTGKNYTSAWYIKVDIFRLKLFALTDAENFWS